MCESPNATDGGPVFWFLSSWWKINRNEDLATSRTVQLGRDLERSPGPKGIWTKINNPSKNPSWCLKHECWAKRSRCSPLPCGSLGTAWSQEQELMFAGGVEANVVQCCLPCPGVSWGFGQQAQGELAQKATPGRARMWQWQWCRVGSSPESLARSSEVMAYYQGSTRHNPRVLEGTGNPVWTDE